MEDCISILNEMESIMTKYQKDLDDAVLGIRNLQVLLCSLPLLVGGVGYDCDANEESSVRCERYPRCRESPYAAAIYSELPYQCIYLVCS